MNGSHRADKKTGLRQRILRFAPGIEALSHYQPAWLRSDIGAGLSVAAVALPVGVAYADLVGVPAVYGIYSGIFPLLAYALFGSSRQLVVGPDAPLCLLVAASLTLLALCLTTSLGVLILGMLPGILLAIALSLLWLLHVGANPTEAVLGKVPELKGYFSVDVHPHARTTPGLLLYRFDASLVFFNVDAFRDRIRKKIDAAATPVEWVVVDASPFNVIDATAIGKIDELQEELSAQGITINFAGVRSDLTTFFEAAWARQHGTTEARFNFPTIDAAVVAFRKNRQKPSAAALDTPS